MSANSRINSPLCQSFSFPAEECSGSQWEACPEGGIELGSLSWTGVMNLNQVVSSMVVTRLAHRMRWINIQIKFFHLF
ncbi:hypothetical protein [Ideonella sp.]|uniref:hypothetical protein n=1 Tax=Ideonella sp. TaxID=1929293 RepID=UPI003BB56E20